MVQQRRDPEQRPSPEALLETARREDSRAGRLKIFVGAAPGVGKTYEMLQSAHAKRKAGADVVVGVVETHGRAETEALLHGLEVLPRKRIDYKDQRIEEMDLDALIARHPQIALVDELAHTNAPGSRHPKRYLDVEELLSRGIDVYTAVNIQHIESLNDVVAQITHVRVRETVPDSVFDRADAIELIDLTPDDLIQRLKEGKVYVPKQAERALEHYFSPGNLTALRELALRRTAERVDEQLLTHMQANAIAGPWAAGERILVCVSEDPRAAGLVRYTKRLADRLHAPWTAISIETRRSLQLTDEQRDRLADTLRLAEALGGEALTIPGVGRRIADDVIRFAQANNVTQIIIGKSTRSWWFELMRGSVVHDLVRRAGNISVNVIRRRRTAGRARGQDRGADRGAARAVQSQALSDRAADRGRRPRRRRTDQAVFRHRECRPGVPHGGGQRRGSLRAVAVAARQRRGIAVLQFLLPAAGLYLHHHRSDQCRGVLLLHADRDPGLQRRGAGAHPGRSPRSAGCAPPNCSMPSAASSRAPRRWTTCCGRPPTRPR